MGKSGKQRKRLRLMRQQNVLQSLPGAPDVHSEDESSDEDTVQAAVSMANGGSKPKICENDLAATLRTLHSLSQDLDLFRSPSMKILRTAIQPLIEDQLKRCKASKDSASAGQVVGKKRTKDPGPPTAESREAEESSVKIRFGSKVVLISRFSYKQPI
jgi:hypothetical protein